MNTETLICTCKLRCLTDWLCLDVWVVLCFSDLRSFWIQHDVFDWISAAINVYLVCIVHTVCAV